MATLDTYTLDQVYSKINSTFGGYVDPQDVELVAGQNMLGDILKCLSDMGAMWPEERPAPAAVITHPGANLGTIVRASVGRSA